MKRKTLGKKTIGKDGGIHLDIDPGVLEKMEESTDAFLKEATEREGEFEGLSDMEQHDLLKSIFTKHHGYLDGPDSPFKAENKKKKDGGEEHG
jgi:hypothetical protein